MRHLISARAAIAVLVVIVVAASTAAVMLPGDDAEPAASAVEVTTTSTALAPTTTVTTAPVELTYPLSGTPAQTRQDRPVLAVKVENSAASRPQAGLEAADVVFEEVVEGGVTRFVALLHSTDPTTIGPVRSVRPMDGPIVEPLRGLFAYSGGIIPFIDILHASGVVDVGADTTPGAYRRDPSRRAPHNLFAATAELWVAAPATVTAPPALFEYRNPDLAWEAAGPRSAGAVDLRFSPASMSSYMFDPPTKRYLRFQDGHPHLGAAGTQLSAANVVVQSVEVHMTGFTDVAGTPVPETVVVGEGPAWVFSGGKYVQGTWSKPDASSLTALRDSAGQVIELAPGPTWVHLLPLGNVPEIR